MRVRRIVAKGQNRRFPEDIKDAIKIKPSVVKEHMFCYCCGREITSVDLKTGDIVAKKAYWLASTLDGFEVYLCGWTRSCYAIQDAKNGGESNV